MTADAEESPNVARALLPVRRSFGLVLLCIIISVAIAAFYASTREERYSASAVLQFRAPEYDEILLGSDVFRQIGDPTRAAATNRDLVVLPGVLERAARSPQLRGLTPREIRDRVSVPESGASELVEIAATDTDPARAAALANAIATAYVGFRRSRDREELLTANRRIESRLADIPKTEANLDDRRALQRRADDLRLLAAVQTGGAEVIGRAQVPRSPASARKALILGGGHVVGLLLGLSLAFLLHALDRRVRTKDELQELTGHDVMASLPRHAALEGTPLHGLPSLPEDVSGAARAMRASVMRRLPERPGVVGVAPAHEHAGASTVSWLMASAAAEQGMRVLLVEGDTRRRDLSGRLAVNGAYGTAGWRTEANLDQAIHASAGGASPDILLAGMRTKGGDPREGHAYRDLKAVLATARLQYDLVVVDCPDLSGTSEAVVAVAANGRFVVVSRLQAVNRDTLREAGNTLASIDASVVGLVAVDAR